MVMTVEDQRHTYQEQTVRGVLHERFPKSIFYLTWEAGNSREEAAKTKRGTTAVETQNAL